MYTYTVYIEYVTFIIIIRDCPPLFEYICYCDVWRSNNIEMFQVTRISLATLYQSLMHIESTVKS